jgi:hypothetical protein
MLLEQLHATDYYSSLARAILPVFSHIVRGTVGAMGSAIFALNSPVKGGILAHLCLWL